MSTVVKVPSYRVKTVRVGQAAPRKTERFSSIQNPAPSFSMTNQGLGMQFSRLMGNGRQWEAAARSPFKLRLVNKTTRVVDLTRLATAFTTEVPTITATTFSIVWTGITALAGDVSTITIGGVLDVTTGTWKITTVSVTLDGTAGHQGDTHAIGTVDIDFAFKPYEVPTKTDQFVVWPQWNGHVYGDATLVQAQDQKLAIPSGAYVFPDGLSTSGAHGQYCALWHRSSRSLLILRTNDTAGRVKQFIYQGDGSNVLLTVRMYPPNNVATTSFVATYEIWLHPMEGERWDAGNWYLGRLQAEAHFALGRGKLKDNASAPVPVSTDIMGIDFWYWPTLDPANQTRAQAATFILEDLTRLKAALPAGRKIGALLYEWHANLFGENWPDVDPVPAETTALVASIKALGIYVWFYTIDAYGSISIWYTGGFNPAFGNPANNRVLTEDGVTPLTFDLATPPNARTLHYAPNFGHNAAGVREPRAHYQDKWDLLLPLVADGNYTDGFGIMYSDFNPLLAAGDRGAGAPFLMAGLKANLVAWKAFCRATRPQWALLNEFPIEDMIHLYDAMAGPVAAPADTVRHVNQAAIVWSQYLMRFGFDIWGVWNSTFGGDYYDGLYFFAALAALSGRPQGAQYSKWSSGNFLVQQPGDADYAHWTAHQAAYMAFMFALEEAWAVGGWREYSRGKRLRPLPGCHERWTEDNGHGWGLTADGAFTKPTTTSMTRPMSTVAQTEEEAQQPIGLLLVNPSDQSVQHDIVMDPSLYPMVRAGVGKRFLVTRNGSTATRVQIKEFSGPLIHSHVLAARSVQLLEVLETAP